MRKWAVHSENLDRLNFKMLGPKCRLKISEKDTLASFNVKVTAPRLVIHYRTNNAALFATVVTADCLSTIMAIRKLTMFHWNRKIAQVIWNER